MKVLIIEDDPDIVETVSLHFELRWRGTELTSTAKGREGIEMIKKGPPDIVILDLGLPDIDGLEVLKEVRLFSDVPVIILTVREQEIDKVRGLDLGADDYIAKPFRSVEFMARVGAVLRRVQKAQAREKPYVSGNIQIDFASHEIHVNGEEVKLTPTEYNLFYYLVKNEGHALTHRTLLERVWGPEYTSATDYVKSYIQRLRAKLEADPQSPKMILTERGVGYKFVNSK